ncbi:MAG: hypothetical protein EBS79_01355 [Gammaproteobacteria bacterium]|nr:hypothetical protein [Gammaproteobacteria bacterium]
MVTIRIYSKNTATDHNNQTRGIGGGGLIVEETFNENLFLILKLRPLLWSPASNPWREGLRPLDKDSTR